AVPLTVTERRTRPADLLARVLLAGAERPFVLAGAPPARAELHLVGSAGGLVVLWLHHAISDLVSVQVLAEELGRLLRGSALAEPGRPMAEVAAAVLAARAGDAAADTAVLGLTVSNRDHPQLRSTVGCLADQLPLVVDLRGR